MNNSFNKALNDALEKEFAWLEGFANPYENYTFSASFEYKMKRIVSMPERSYVSIGRRRVRKSLVAALIAILIFAMCGCAVAIVVNWNETQNLEKGTLDVDFDIKNSKPADFSFECIVPNAPDGYSKSKQTNNNSSCTVEYTNEEGSTILYSQDSYVENMSLSIDNENAEISEIKVNGYKGYSYKKNETNMLIWTDGIYLYTIQGTCEMTILEDMSLKLSYK